MIDVGDDGTERLQTEETLSSDGSKDRCQDHSPRVKSRSTVTLLTGQSEPRN